jgi:hypothetical protein
LKPEDRYDMKRLHDNGRAVNRGDGIVEGYGFQGGEYSPLTKAEQLDLAVDLDNLEEALRFAPDGNREREMLRKWVDRLCK